jgi:hypothetical protein
MKKLLLSLVLATFVLAGLVPVTTKAVDLLAAVETIVQTKQITLQVQNLAYDSGRNMYNYSISWVVPRGYTYSLKLDDQLYQKRISKTGSVEIGFWIAPSSSHTLAVYSLANGRGRLIHKGAFTAPAAPVASEADQHLLLKAYLDTYPALPTGEVQDPTGAAQVLTLVRTLNDFSTVNESLPYLDSTSAEAVRKIPALLEAGQERTSLAFMSIADTKVSMLTGGKYATVAVTEQQKSTNYRRTQTIVFVKEAASWKFDFIGTTKKGVEQYFATNPTGQAVSGTGKTDLAVDDFDYLEDSPKVGDKNLVLYVKIDNKGTTTVNSYEIAAQLNGSDVIDSAENTTPLAPGQSVIFAVPMGHYWDLQGVKKDAGSYRTDIDVLLNPSSLDADNSNNGFYMNMNFK